MTDMSLTALSKALGWDSSAVVERQKSNSWVVQDLIAADSVAWIYGAPGSYKSFLAMDMAMSVATGKPWQGRDVSQGSVLFIAAEGGDDIHIRRAAWVKHNGHDGMLKITSRQPQIDSQREDDYSERPPIRHSGYGQLMEAIGELTISFDDAANTMQERVESVRLRQQGLEAKRRKLEAALVGADQDAANEHDQAIQEIEEELVRLEDAEIAAENAVGALSDSKVQAQLAPKLVVIDTFAATASDDTKDVVNRYTRNLYRALKRLIPGAAFLVVDHTTKGGDTWMGSQAKLGNVDMMAEASAKGDVLTLSMKGGRGKIKGAAQFEDISLKMVSQELGCQDAYGRELQSLVCTDGTKAKRLADLSGDSTGGILLAQIGESGEVSRDELRGLFGNHKANDGKKPDSVSRAFRRALKNLVDDGLVIESGDLITVNT